MSTDARYAVVCYLVKKGEADSFSEHPPGACARTIIDLDPNKDMGDRRAARRLFSSLAYSVYRHFARERRNAAH